MESLSLPSNLENVIEQKTLKWVFVGGKGGVGKTTVSCSLAIALARVRKSVLLLSTDPAHNLSDAFGQKFSKNPEIVQGYENLWAMEIDPTTEDDDEEDEALGMSEDRKMLSGIASAMPGIDEAISFSKVMKLVQSMEYEVVVFDTAPTGHTLRFLHFPSVLGRTFGGLFGGGGLLGGLMQQMLASLHGGEMDVEGRVGQTQDVVEKVGKQFRDASLTTFVAVTAAEFLPLYETERLLQELTKMGIEVRNIVVNQMLAPEEAKTCAHCKAKSQVQQRYVKQMKELYDGLFHVSYLPAVTYEVRGLDALKTFSQFLLQDNTKMLIE